MSKLGYHSWEYQDRGKPRSKYQRKPHHKKKEKKDTAWRDHKKVRRDKSKKNYRKMAYPIRFFKNYSNRTMRRVIKEEMFLGDWDNWMDHGLDYYVDPWGWD